MLSAYDRWLLPKDAPAASCGNCHEQHEDHGNGGPGCDDYQADDGLGYPED